MVLFELLFGRQAFLPMMLRQYITLSAASSDRPHLRATKSDKQVQQ